MKKAKPPRALDITKLRWRCDTRRLGFRTTAELPYCREIIGQAHAIGAMRLGLEIHSPGYNIFVAGLTGTGKATAIKQLLDELHLPGDVPDDLCYVHNFRQPEAPIAIRLPAGRGRVLRQDMHDLVDYFRRSLPEVYESEAFQARRRRLLEDFKERGRNIFRAFEARIEKEKFQIVQIEMGPLTRAEIYPIVGGEPTSLDKLADMAAQQQFDSKELARLREKHLGLATQMETVLQEGRAVERGLRQAIRALEREFGAMVVHGPIQDLHEKYAGLQRVVDYLAQVEESIVESLPRSAARVEDSDGRSDDGALPALSAFDQYQVNLVVDNTDAKGPPIIIESRLEATRKM